MALKEDIYISWLNRLLLLEKLSAATITAYIKDLDTNHLLNEQLRGLRPRFYEHWQSSLLHLEKVQNLLDKRQGTIVEATLNIESPALAVPLNNPGESALIDFLEMAALEHEEIAAYTVTITIAEELGAKKD